MVTSGVEAALQLFEALKLKLSNGFVMAITELRISGVFGVCAPRQPLPSMLSRAVAGMFELNILKLLLLLLLLLLRFVFLLIGKLFKANWTFYVRCVQI